MKTIKEPGYLFDYSAKLKRKKFSEAFGVLCQMVGYILLGCISFKLALGIFLVYIGHNFIFHTNSKNYHNYGNN